MRASAQTFLPVEATGNMWRREAPGRKDGAFVKRTKRHSCRHQASRLSP
jgi:hypothetical protein